MYLIIIWSFRSDLICYTRKKLAFFDIIPVSDGRISTNARQQNIANLNILIVWSWFAYLLPMSKEMEIQTIYSEYEKYQRRKRRKRMLRCRKKIVTKSEHSNEIDIDDVFNSIFHWHNVSYSLNVERILIEPSMFQMLDTLISQFLSISLAPSRSLLSTILSRQRHTHKILLATREKKKAVLFAAVHECFARCICDVICISLYAMRPSFDLELKLVSARFYSLLFYSDNRVEKENKFRFCLSFTF